MVNHLCALATPRRFVRVVWLLNVALLLLFAGQICALWIADAGDFMSLMLFAGVTLVIVSLFRVDSLAVFKPLMKWVLASRPRTWLLAFLIFVVCLQFSLVLDTHRIAPNGAALMGLAAVVNASALLLLRHIYLPDDRLLTNNTTFSPAKPPTRVVVVIILFLALLTSGYTWLSIPPKAWYDATTYFHMSQGLLGRVGLETFWANPGYAVVIAFTRLLADNIASMLLLQHMLRALVSLLAFYLLKPQHFWLGAAAGMALAFSPVTADQAHILLTESVYGNLVTLAVLLIYAAITRPRFQSRLGMAFGAGAICCLSAFIRPTGLLFLGMLVVLLLLFAPSWKKLAVLFGGFGIALIGLSTILWLFTGEFQFINNNNEAYYAIPLVAYDLYDLDNGAEIQRYQKALKWEGCEYLRGIPDLAHGMEDCASNYNRLMGDTLSTRAVYIEAVRAQPLKFLSHVFEEVKRFFVFVSGAIEVWQRKPYDCERDLLSTTQHPSILPMSALVDYVCRYPQPRMSFDMSGLATTLASIYHQLTLLSYRALTVPWARLWIIFGVMAFTIIEARPAVRVLAGACVLTLIYHALITAAGQYVITRYVMVMIPIFILLSLALYATLLEGLFSIRIHTWSGQFGELGALFPWRAMGGRLLPLVVFGGLGVLIPSLSPLPSDQTAIWMREHVADQAYVIAETGSEDVLRTSLGQDTTGVAETWKWESTPGIWMRDAKDWLGLGAHYLVMDSRSMMPDSFYLRPAEIKTQAVMKLYESEANPLGLGPQQSVYWSFRPQQLLNLNFDGNLRLIGYDLQENPDDKLMIRLLWYTEQIPAAAYSIFLHFFDPLTGEIIRQNDQLLGSETHPTNIWRKNELVFQEIFLPIEGLSRPYHFRFGLYQLTTGTRAQIRAEDGTPVGDNQVIALR